MTYKTWHDSEVEYLRNSASESFLDDLAKHLDRPAKMVRYKLDKLGLKAKDGRAKSTGVKPSVWTPERLSYLRENASLLSASEIAEHLGLTEKQVRTSMYERKIRGRGVSRKQDQDEIQKRIEPLRGVEKVDRSAPRKCPGCGEVKPIFQFPSEKTIESALCEDCRKAGRSERWAEKSPEDRARIYLAQRLNRHGLSLEKYQEMLDRQGNACAVCAHGFNEVRRPEIDHDHGHCSGVSGCSECVRGLLCSRCNTATGWAETFHASPEFLHDIANYLGR